MKTVGIIAEYNPFHNGHCLQIREIQRHFPDAGIVVAMSGSFTQRGTAAILDKWQRAEAAVRHGASLVLELPTVFSTRSAQYFAEGSVRLLDRIGVVDAIAFGSECKNLKSLTRLANEIDAMQQSIAMKNRLQKGGSYAAAITEAADPDTDIRQPNVILAVEYLRAIRRFHVNLSPTPLPRFSAGHHDSDIPSVGDCPIASASAIRAALAHGIERGALRAVPGVVFLLSPYPLFIPGFSGFLSYLLSALSIPHFCCFSGSSSWRSIPAGSRGCPAMKFLKCCSV